MQSKLQKHERRDEFIREALRAKEEGLIRHISFSFHDKPEVMCLPYCPEEVNISHIFQAMNYYRVYSLKEYAYEHYHAIGTRWVKGKKADACLDCGECEPHCPQHIPIREQLKECLTLFHHYTK